MNSPSIGCRGSTRFIVAPPSGDRSRDTGQTPVSFLVLRWTGNSYVIELERFFRNNHSELVGVFLKVALADLRPLYEQSPRLFGLLFLISIVACPAGWALWARARRSTA